ncbi:hypothetical protein OCGS_2609 [Oceaniovalibus guishaninsula JLT2003]|uniref:PEP-CTERM protein-sorting domain-containing protein n=1 Tax=Oceaniovalibus guishaninsula JLT2003 TaxID=1231392 RepID=K2H9I3_9RHOB|nr:VPLPA-CTERM sorting domain-containing protein [Oceaniovalibus guishaninsula]EKE43272.1 hypothetical protein OCGS_2609 [Oceaniovalibus guishaninsula JLT2003]
MYTKLFGAAAAAAVMVSGAQAFAATLLIDDFSTVQSVSDVPSAGLTNASQAAGPGILGGFRDLQVSNTANNGNPTNATELEATGTSLAFNNNAQARGTGTVTYDGDDDPTTLNPFGLGGVNLNIGTDPFFAFDVDSAAFDGNALFRLTAYDMLGNQVSYQETLAGGFETTLDFGSLTGDAGFDFGQVGALEFFISTEGTAISIDGVLNSISVQAGDTPPVVPLPASALLLLGGIGGLSVMRARRRKS